MADIKPSTEGDAASWTPRQALMFALTECDNWDAVVIMAMKKDGKPHGINATPNNVIRAGLLGFGLANIWDDEA